MIIGLSGKAQAGKDTVGSFLVEQGFTRMAFADKLKEFMYQLNPGVALFAQAKNQSTLLRLASLVDSAGWEKAKELPEVRTLLQRCGTDAGRNVLGENVWVDAVEEEIRKNGYDKVVVTDVRFPNEAEWVRAVGGKLWRIKRPAATQLAREATQHPSETALDDWPHFDCTLHNDGSLETLRARVEVLIETFYR